jgi:hypothetical protein
MPPKKKKGKNKAEASTAAPTVAMPSEDEITTKLEEAFLGTIIFDVRNLETQWRKGQNRTINPKHVDTLKAEFQVNIRRYSIEDRMWVTLSKSDFEAYLCWIYNRANKRDPTAAELADLQKEAKLRTTPTLIVDRKVTGISLPVLQAGQHRRAALISLLKEVNQAALNGAVDSNGDLVKAPESTV